MNQPFFWVFLITYFLSFDAVFRNPIAGTVSFMGSTLGVILTAFNSVKSNPN
jgi:hypothetical protein